MPPSERPGTSVPGFGSPAEAGATRTSAATAPVTRLRLRCSPLICSASMSLWDSVADLEVRVDGYRLRRRESQTPSGWTRVTTTIALEGDDVTGEGEDVTYTGDDHEHVPDELMLAGTWSLED